MYILDCSLKIRYLIALRTDGWTGKKVNFRVASQKIQNKQVDRFLISALLGRVFSMSEKYEGIMNPVIGGLEPVLSHTEKLCLASYYFLRIQKCTIIWLKPVF